MRRTGLKPARRRPFPLLELNCRMARRSDNKLRPPRVIGGIFVILLGCACEPIEATLPAARVPARDLGLSVEIQRLAQKVTVLEVQVQQEQRNAARARQQTQEQRERIAMLEAQTVVPADGAVGHPPPASAVTTIQAEAELRVAYRAMMRAIDRLDISPEEKAALKGSLRPTRSLDRQNPWSVASFE